MKEALSDKKAEELPCERDLADQIAELRRSEERYRQLFNSAYDAVFLWPIMPEGPGGNFAEVNDAACKWLGYTREEMERKSSIDIEPDVTAEQLEARARQLLSLGGCILQTQLLTKAGRRIPVEVSFRLFEWDGQQMMLSIARDLTERRQLEEQFRQAQKMEAVGQLAGGVAHDFNNILSATLMHLGLLQLQQSPPLPMGTKESLKEMESEIRRAADLTRQLLLFSRRQLARVETLDLNQLITELLKMVRRLIGEKIEVTFRGSPTAPWVAADAGMLEQVVMNLCINARDAMPQGGKLTVGTMLVERAANSTKLHLEARPGNFVCLVVTDTGCGMDEAVLKRIFEPFFTTKETGKGTGLGLATVYGIVKLHQGWIEVESAVGKGSSFRVYLPVLLQPLEKKAVPFQAEEAHGGSETILLVEDELSLRRMAALCLRKLGYGVLDAPNGTEALKLWEENQQIIELLLTDMVLPGSISGLDLAQLLQTKKVSLRILISSGYPMDLARSSLLGPTVGFMPKPFGTATLAKLVRQCLDKEGRIK